MVTAQLVGREPEAAALAVLLEELDEQRGSALLIRGEAGIGKSALLMEASRRAAEQNARVLKTTGVESEAHLPFAGLHQLLRPILDEARHLPEPQRRAIEAAFGQSPAEAPDLFFTALAALELVSEAADRAPLLLVIDDAQWLDRATADVLAFVARRLDTERIGLLAAIRAPHGTTIEGRTIELGPLDDDAAARLLDDHAPDLQPAVKERILQEAAGNPLALTELPLANPDLGDGLVLPTWLPLTTRLEQAFAARVQDLPDQTRMLLLVAALNDGDAIAEALEAATLLTGTPTTIDDLTPAVDANLVDADGVELRFRHPLIRSAIHQAANLSQRHAAHRALATTLEDEPDRRVWHRSAARLAPDERVATELDEAAARAQRRGAIATAVTALERAAQLSGSTASKSARLLQAAELAADLGRSDVMQMLLREAESLDLPARGRARVAWLRELHEERLWSGASQLSAYAELADGDADRALATLLPIAHRCWWSNADKATRDAIVEAAEQLPVADDDPRLLSILATAAPAERGAAVLQRMGPPAPGADPATAFQLATAATAVGNYAPTEPWLAAAVEGLRVQGRLGLLVHALVGQAWMGIQLSRFDVAVPAAEEARRLADETAQPRWGAVAQLAQAMIAGMRGDEATAEREAAAAEAVLLPMGANPILALVQFARGRAALAAGRHADAYEHLARIFDPADIAYHVNVRTWALLDLVDAAVHSERHDAARDAVERMEGSASPILRANVICARPLVTGDFGPSLDADLTDWPALRARLLLAYGAWLRRQRRAADSRQPLRAAREAFDAIGLVPWGERARQELRAAGETSRRRTPDLWDELTPQELQIAQMAAEGLTNREIGQRLYLSHRTVSTHLYRIFPKLGITSRAELRAALPSVT
jgi:DNA-binding CsgD family transcriptional regulator